MRLIHKNWQNKLILFIVILLIIIITIFTGYQTYKSTQLEYGNENSLIKKQREKEERVKIYTEYFLEIIKNKLQRQGDKIILEGAIRNKGNLSLNDVKLMVYLVDVDSMNLIESRIMIVQSNNGRPLLKNGRRYFNMEIEGVDAENPDFIIIVNDIDFASDAQGSLERSTNR